MNSEIVTLDFEVTQVVSEDFDRVDVYCPGTGLAERKRFTRASFSLNTRLDPYALAAQEWFENHPPKRDWKVGDVVPRGTAVGKDWVAAPLPNRTPDEYGGLPSVVGPTSWLRYEARILWIAEHSR